LDTPLHILIKMYETFKGNESQHYQQLDEIEDIIQLILPFCEASLSMVNRNHKNPIQLVRSLDLKQILQDYFDENYDGSIEESTFRNIDAPPTQSEDV
jgi:hypothetical protein